jgi:hypothetical protein
LTLRAGWDFYDMIRCINFLRINAKGKALTAAQIQDLIGISLFDSLLLLNAVRADEWHWLCACSG